MLLEVDRLEAGYGVVPVLRGLSLHVASGEVIAVLGANGAGKSTLNRVLSGLMPPWSGHVRFEGIETTGQDAAAMVEAGLVHVPEGRRIFPNLNVRENLELGSYRRGRPRRRQNLERAFEIFPRLKERTSQAAGTLSGGEQQMLSIARGLMAEPKLLILDEPSLGLSPLLVEEMFGLVQRICADGLGILLVEQNVMQSLAIASRAYMLENGAFTLEGPAAALLENPQLKKAYLGL
ncbi:MAG: branched-chain amino acid ABC transporter ATP-binding protein [Rhizobiales bacterium 62-17]|nr:ABC transporter ATP-binding protein [Hyphomicrobiales bacterium]OJY02151.1 MAG: branched-chain amino acid ABC transporter ATP-binding protein [Rhizobiales bacterium 62-17]